MAKRWRIHPHDPARIAALQHAAGIPAVVAELLICRGVSDPAAARDFLDPKLSALRDPELLPGCRQAAERIHAAVAARRPIAVYGDYDVDGMTGTAILWLCLKLLGGRGALLRSPSHRRGLRAERRGHPHAGRRKGRAAGDGRLRHRQRRRSGAGPRIGHRADHHRSSRARAAVARGRGHRPSAFAGRRLSVRRAERLGRGDEAGLGALPAGQRGQAGRPADEGFSASRPWGWPRWAPWPTSCRWSTRTACWSVTAWRAWPTRPRWAWPRLMAVAKVAPRKHPDGKTRLDAEDVGFQIAPRLNAAGRLGQPQLAVELLVTDRPERAQELGPVHRRTERHAADLGAEHPACRRQAGQGTVRSGRRRRAGAGRPRLASGRDRHRGRPAGRPLPPAGGDDLVGQGGHAAGHRLGPQRARVQPARGAGRVRRVSAGPRRPRGGGRA